MKIINIVTVSMSCVFFRGSLGYLKRRGFEGTLVSSPGEALDQVANDEEVCAHAIPMEREISPLKDLVSLWKIYRLLKKEKPTIVNAGTPKAGLLGMLAARLAGVPIRVFQHRGLRLETMRGIKRTIVSITDKITCACASKIVCNSESLRKRLLELKLTSAGKTTVLNKGSSKGVDPVKYRLTSEYLMVAQKFRRERRIPPDALILGFIGRLVKDKGIDELIQAFQRILTIKPNTYLILVGPDESGDPIDTSGLDWLRSHPRVYLAGHCTNVLPFYNLFDVLAFPSYREGFPNVVMEAAAMGVPTVGFRATGVVDAVVDGETGILVPMKDAEAMADAIKKYLDDPNLRIRHGLNARKRVVRDFQPPMLWEAYYREYCELLKAENLPIPTPNDANISDMAPLVDPDQDAEEFCKWLAMREILLCGRDPETACRLCGADQNEIHAMMEQCPFHENGSDQGESA